MGRLLNGLGWRVFGRPLYAVNETILAGKLLGCQVGNGFDMVIGFRGIALEHCFGVLGLQSEFRLVGGFQGLSILIPIHAGTYLMQPMTEFEIGWRSEEHTSE